MNIAVTQNTQKLYNNILHLFRQQQQSAHSLITFYRAKKILDVQANKILDEDFNHELFSELWDYIDNQNKQQRQVIKIAQTFVSAYRILSQRISNIQDNHGILEQKKITLATKRIQLTDYRQNKDDFYVKRISQLQTQCQSLQQQIQLIQNNHQTFKRQMAFIQAVLIFNEKILPSKIININTFQQQKQSLLEKQSKSLKIIFYLTILGILCEMFSMANSLRYSFMALLCYLICIQVLFIGYITYSIVKNLILAAILSIIMDIVTIYLFSLCQQSYTSINSIVYYHICYPEHQLAMINYFSLGTIMISVICRIILSISWLRHRVCNKKQYYFWILGLKINLNKRVVLQRLKQLP